MDRQDYFDLLAKATPLLLQASRHVFSLLSPGQRGRIREAERLRRIGDSQHRDGRYEQAVHTLWESLRLNPTDTLAWLYLVRAYRASNQTPLALVAAGCALYVTDDPARQSRIWSVIGQCNRDDFERSESRQDLQAAVTAFDRASKLDPFDAIPHWNLLEVILPTIESTDSPYIVSGLDLPARAINAVNDLIALLRNGDGNTTIYAGMIAADVRQLAHSMSHSDYWTAQLATVEESARALSLIDTLPAKEPRRSAGLAWKMAVGTAALLLVAAFALITTGCSTGITDPDSAACPQTASHSRANDTSSLFGNEKAYRDMCIEAGTSVKRISAANATGAHIQTKKAPKTNTGGRERIEHVNGDDGRCMPWYYLFPIVRIEHANGDDGRSGPLGRDGIEMLAGSNDK